MFPAVFNLHQGGRAASQASRWHGVWVQGALLLMLLLGVCPVSANTVTWTLGADGNWDAAGAWSSSPNLPGSADDVLNSTTFTITHSTGNDIINSFLSDGAFILSGGSLSGATSSSTFQVNNTFTMEGGTLSNFIINSGTGGSITFNTSTNNLLNGDTLNANLDLTNGGFAGIENGTINSSKISLDKGATLDISGTPTFNVTSIVFGTTGSASNLDLEGGTTLTIPSGTTLSGNIGILGQPASNFNGSTLINNGTINSNTSGNTTTISAYTTFTNNGTLEANNGASLTLNSSWTNTGQFDLSGGASYTLSNNRTLTNTGGSISVADSTFNIAGGTLTGGSLTTTGTGGLSFSTNSNNLLNGVTLTTPNLDLTNGGFAGIEDGTLKAPTISLDKGATLDLQGSPVLNTTSIVFGTTGSASNLDIEGGTTLTIPSGTTLSGNIGILGQPASNFNGSTLINNGTINSNTSGNTTTISAYTTFTNNGTLEASNGASLSLSSAWTNTGQFDLSGGASYTLSNNRTLTNTGGSISVADSTFNFSGGTVVGGNVTTTGTGGLSFSTSANNLLNGVTLTTPNLDLTNGGFAGIEDGTLNAPTISLDKGATLDLQGSPVLNTTSIVFGTTGSASNLDIEGGTTLTIPSGTTLSGNIGTIGQPASNFNGSTLINNGTINSDVSGNTSTISAYTTFTNNGTLEANNGATINIASSPTNTGTIQDDSTSTISTNSDLDQTGGSTQIDGTLDLRSGNSTFYLQGGSLSGIGTVQGNVNNASHVHPGDAPGTLTITGNYTQTSLGNLDIDLAGTPTSGHYGHLKISGNATLDGALNVSLVNGFVPTIGTTYDILDYGTGSGGGTLSGQFATLTGMDSTFNYTISYNSSLKNVTLQVAPVPGPSSVIVLGLGLLSVGVRLRRRLKVA